MRIEQKYRHKCYLGLTVLDCPYIIDSSKTLKLPYLKWYLMYNRPKNVTNISDVYIDNESILDADGNPFNSFYYIDSDSSKKQDIRKYVGKVVYNKLNPDHCQSTIIGFFDNNSHNIIIDFGLISENHCDLVMVSGFDMNEIIDSSSPFILLEGDHGFMMESFKFIIDNRMTTFEQIKDYIVLLNNGNDNSDSIGISLE